VSEPLVTIGVPVYRGKDDLPVTLECLRTQSYANLDILISVDAGDQESALACQPFLGDPRFRLFVHAERLGWAGNTDWTMRQRRGDFYIYQQHDDQISPTYVADLVAAASRERDASICFAKMRFSGLVNSTDRGFSIRGDPAERVLTFLRGMAVAPLRGLIRTSALATTSGLLLNAFDPLESFGTETRLLAELAVHGDFVFVPGPVYFKRVHGANLHLKRATWSMDRNRLSWACLCAWMAEVVVAAGRTPAERRSLFDVVLARFLAPSNPWRRAKRVVRQLTGSSARLLYPILAVVETLKKSESLVRSVTGGWALYQPETAEDRATFLHLVFDQLRGDARLDPKSLESDWELLEQEACERYAGTTQHSSSSRSTYQISR
jgi:glycosyltransferase involved in cell wall biosynthesis